MTDQSPKTIAGPPLSGAPGSAWTETDEVLPPELTIVDAAWEGTGEGQAIRSGLYWNQHPKGYRCRRPAKWKMPNDQAHT